MPVVQWAPAAANRQAIVRIDGKGEGGFCATVLPHKALLYDIFGRTIVFLVHSKLVARKLEVARASHPRGALARAFRGQKHFHLPSAAALQELGI